LNANVTGVFSFKLKPELFHWSRIKLVIKFELLLLFIKKGFDKFNVTVVIKYEGAKTGIIK
jgi:hypothetical protein